MILATFPLVDADDPTARIEVATERNRAPDAHVGPVTCYIVREVVGAGDDARTVTVIDRTYLPGIALAVGLAAGHWAEAVAEELVGDIELGTDLAATIVTDEGRAVALARRRRIIAGAVPRWAEVGPVAR